MNVFLSILDEEHKEISREVNISSYAPKRETILVYSIWKLVIFILFRQHGGKADRDRIFHLGSNGNDFD
jgi:hypothetical protein